MSGFHTPSQSEIYATLPLMLHERRNNIRLINGLVIAELVGTAAFVFFGITKNDPRILLGIIPVFIFLIPTVIIAIKNTRAENAKVKMLEEGDVLIIDAQVINKGEKSQGRYATVKYVDAEYLDNGKQRIQTFIVTRWLYKRSKIGGTGYILKFSGDSKWIDGKIVFLPKEN